MTTPIMNAKMYVSFHGEKCPFCTDIHIEADNPEVIEADTIIRGYNNNPEVIEADTIIRVCKCNSCKETWTEIYTLSDMETDY